MTVEIRWRAQWVNVVTKVGTDAVSKAVTHYVRHATILSKQNSYYRICALDHYENQHEIYSMPMSKTAGEPNWPTVPACRRLDVRVLFRQLSMISLLTLMLSACELDLSSSGNNIEDYETARRVFWSEVYPDGGNTLYCDDQFDSHDRRGVNIEHVFPMSWVTNALDCGTRNQCRNNSSMFNRIEADLHNLYPARTKVNSSRASFRFGEVRGEARRFGQACDFEVDHRARVAEPRPAVRGEVARAMFYMAMQYREQGLTIFARSGKILQGWHNEDPPTEQERRRNDKIAQLQGTSNPFVDEPEHLNTLIGQGYFY